MPTQLNLSATDRQFAQQDVSNFNKYDHYFTLFSAAELPNWEVWSKLTASVKWTPNMGTTMRAITPERSPVREQQPRPENVTSPAKRNVYSQKERTEDARVKHHKFESDQIHWLGPWQDVRSNQLDPLLRDITRQQAIFNDHFIREQAFQRAPYIYVCGYEGSSNLGTDALVEAPNTKDSADAVPKTAAFLTELAAKCTGLLTLEELDLTSIILKNDLGALPFNGPKGGMPLKNDLLKGTFAYCIGDEAWNNFKWGENANFLKALDSDFIFKTFSGRLFGRLDCQAEPYPLRMSDDGTFPDPEVEDEYGFIRPNPSYIKAPFEFAWGMGDDFGASIEIGPPPKDFASGKVTDASAKLIWNGKPQLTDKFLVKHGNGDYELNSTYGEFRKIIAKTICGYIPKRALNAFPILYKRARVARDN